VPKPTPDNKSTPRPRIIWHTGGGRRPARCSGRSSGAKHARASTPTGSVICWQGLLMRALLPTEPIDANLARLTVETALEASTV